MIQSSFLRSSFALWYGVALAAVFMTLGVGVLAKEDEDDEWYGSGYRDPAWILERGGTIIKYRVKGLEKSKDYKARMYLHNRMVEIEYGGQGYFDDAINNRYKVILFKGTDKKMSTDVIARPGQEVSITFDLKKDRVDQEMKQVVPFRNIRLTSGSARYITLKDLGRVSVQDQAENLETKQEEENHGSTENFGEDSDAGGESVEEKLSSIEATFETLEIEIPAQFALLETQSKPFWFIFGPNEEILWELPVYIEAGEEALDKIDSLVEEMEQGEPRTSLEEKRERVEEFLSKQIERFQEKQRSTSIWYRFRTLLHLF